MEIAWLVAWILVGLAVAGLAGMSLLARRPAPLGLRNGRLAPCPATPNCVCTEDSDPGHAIEPIAFTGEPAEALVRLKRVLAELPRARIVSEEGFYLHAEFRSLVFRFVDDAEFRLDPEARLIHCRSASRVGHSDLGVNRRRIEEIRRRFSITPEVK
jgi:uncharacterized protein (DUF1499 family)